MQRLIRAVNRHLNTYIYFLFFVIVALTVIKISTGVSYAITSPYPTYNPTTSTSGIVSQCPSGYGHQTTACHTEVSDITSQFTIWEPAPSQSVQLDIKYSCWTGFQGFDLSYNSTTISYKNVCKNKASSWSPVIGSISGDTNQTVNDSGGSSPYTISNFNCNGYNGLYCFVNVTITALSVPSNSYGFQGGNVWVGLSVSGADAPDILPASASSSTSRPSYSNPVAINSSGQDVSGQGWNYNVANPFSQNAGSRSFKFQAPCNFSGSQAYFGWESVLWNDPTDGTGNEKWTLTNLTTGKTVATYIFNQQSSNVYDSNHNFISSSIPATPGGAGPFSDQQDSQYANTVFAWPWPKADITPGQDYSWDWSNLGDENIVYSLPFSQNSYDEQAKCWQLNGQSTVSNSTISTDPNNPPISTQFNHEIGNKGPYTASYTWKVQGCYYTKSNGGSSYCGSSTTNPNWYKGCSSSDPNNTGPSRNPVNGGAAYCSSHSNLPMSSDYQTPYYTCSPGTYSKLNYCPDYAGNKTMVNYSFPSSVQTGDGYCERIYYTDVNGPNDLDVAASNPVCVSYTGPGNTSPPPSQGASCTAINFDSGTMKPGANGNMYYAVYAYVSNSSSTSPYNTSNDGSPSSWTDWPTADANGNDSASVLSSSTPYPDVTTNSLTNPSGSTNPYVVHSYAFTNRIITYKMTNSQLQAGNVIWYAITFNVWPGQGSGPPYYLRVDNIYTTTVNDCFATRTCSIDVASPWNTPGQVLANSSYNFNVTYQNSDQYELNDSLNLSDGTFGLNSAGTIDTDNLTNHIKAYYLGSAANYLNSSQAIDINAMGAYSTYGPTQNYSFTAPNDTNSNTLSVSAGYENTSMSSLINCQTPVDDYQQFNYTSNALAVPIKSQANQQQTTENPGAIKKIYDYNESGSSTQPNNLDLTGSLYYVPAGGAPPTYSSVSCGQPTQVECDPNLQQSPSPVVHYYNIPGTPSAGDSYCILVSLSPSTGYVGPGGNYINPYNWPNSTTEPSPASGGCTTIHNEPYVSVTGNDVIGSTDFNDTCQQPASSGIYTFSTNSSNNYTPPYSTTPGTGGSASQFGAQAINIIEGFGSASFRNGSNTYAPKGTNALGLSFANGIDNTSNVSPSPPTDGNAMGGDFGYSQNDSSCEPDYYHDDKPLANNLISANTGNIDQLLSSNNTPAPATSLYNGYNYYSNSSLTVGNGGGSIDINNGVKATIFVNGNVYITSNIDYSGANGGPGGWNAISDIPSFYIIALGNIFIAPNVTQLDGAYIAQPTSETSRNTGIIDTCSNGFQAYSPSVLYGNQTGCNQQLTINGAFVDQATLLDRSFSSLRYSEAGENTISNFSGHNSGTSCGHPGQDIHNSFGSNPTEDCAAEIFNFSPELYLSQPSFQPASGPTIGKYNFVTSLSPTL